MIPELIYCAGGAPHFSKIAVRHGYTYGACLPSTTYYPVQFADQDFKKYQKATPERRIKLRANYMAALKNHRPRFASVLDWQYDEQLPEILSWAEEAAEFAGEIILIPKVMGGISKLPRSVRGKPVRLGYSTPSTTGSTELPLWEFAGWPVHILGGSPQAQMKLTRYFDDVRSVDGNYAQNMAVHFNQYFTPGVARHAKNRYWPMLSETSNGFIDHNAYHAAFELSCINIRAAWAGKPYYIRYASTDDIPAVKKIADSYKKELGFVNRTALAEAIVKLEVYIAILDQKIVGFVHWHQRIDGWRTLYEIAVSPAYRGLGLGSFLLSAVATPVRLKCTQDNPANKFYESQGMQCIGVDPGRVRPLNIWQKGEVA